MKAMTSFRYSHWEHISKYAENKKHLIIKRTTPFLLLSLFLSFWLVYTLVAATEISIATKLILYPFMLINLALADFALWNYLKGKKRWLIWTFESIATAMIIYWLL
jgi:hypothetical protein